MVLFILLLLVLGLFAIALCLGATFLIEPIVGILIFIGIVGLFKKLIR